VGVAKLAQLHAADQRTPSTVVALDARTGKSARPEESAGVTVALPFPRH